MPLIRSLLLAAASLVMPLSVHAGAFADAVVYYLSGAGVNPDYTDPASALGEPARVTPGAFGGPVDPFAPPYLNTQVVSIGEGGSLTVHFSQAIFDAPDHPFGIDFLVFGNTGFWVFR